MYTFSLVVVDKSNAPAPSDSIIDVPTSSFLVYSDNLSTPITNAFSTFSVIKYSLAMSNAFIYPLHPANMSKQIAFSIRNFFLNFICYSRH